MRQLMALGGIFLLGWAGAQQGPAVDLFRGLTGVTRITCEEFAIDEKDWPLERVDEFVTCFQVPRETSEVKAYVDRQTFTGGWLWDRPLSMKSFRYQSERLKVYVLPFSGATLVGVVNLSRSEPYREQEARWLYLRTVLGYTDRTNLGSPARGVAYYSLKEMAAQTTVVADTKTLSVKSGTGVVMLQPGTRYALGGPGRVDIKSPPIVRAGEMFVTSGLLYAMNCQYVPGPDDSLKTFLCPDVTLYLRPRYF